MRLVWNAHLKHHPLDFHRFSPRSHCSFPKVSPGGLIKWGADKKIQKENYARSVTYVGHVGVGGYIWEHISSISCWNLHEWIHDTYMQTHPHVPCVDTCMRTHVPCVDTCTHTHACAMCGFMHAHAFILCIYPFLVIKGGTLLRGKYS